MVRLLATLPEIKVYFDIPKLLTQGETYPLLPKTYPILYGELSKSGEKVDSVELQSSTNGHFLFGYTHQSQFRQLHYKSFLDELCDCLSYLLCPKKVKICT